MSIQTERLKILKNELLAQEEAAKRREEELDEQEKKNAEEFLREGIWKYFELLLKKNPHQTTLELHIGIPSTGIKVENDKTKVTNRPNAYISFPYAELNFSRKGLQHAYNESSKFGISSGYVPDPCNDWRAPQQIAFKISIGD